MKNVRAVFAISGAVFLGLLVASVHAETIIIDSFDNPTNVSTQTRTISTVVISTSTAAPWLNDNTGAPATNGLFDIRTIHGFMAQGAVASGRQAATLTGTSSFSNGALTFAGSKSAISGTSYNYVYDELYVSYTTSVGDGYVDLTGYSKFLLNISNSSLTGNSGGSGQGVWLSVYDFQGLTQTFPIASGTTVAPTGVLEAPFTGFAGDAGFDWSQVMEATIWFSYGYDSAVSNTNADKKAAWSGSVTMTEFSIASVPEPSTLALCGLGGAGASLAFFNRRWRRRTA